MAQESATLNAPIRPAHRIYAAEFKAELLAACQQPGVSVAGLARLHGMNAGVLHRWLRESAPSSCQQSRAAKNLDTPTAQTAAAPTPAFIPLRLVPAAQQPGSPALEVGLIKVELRKGALAMTISWPVAAAADLAQWSVAVLQ